MMATAETNYAPGSITTSTSAPGYNSGDNSMLDFWNDMARRRRAAQMAPPARRPMMGGGGQPNFSHFGPQPGERSLASTRAEAAKLAILEAQAQEAQAEAQAASGTIPTTLHPGGAGYTGAFKTPDAFQMTGAQRKAFLPGGSTQIAAEENPAEDDWLIRARAGRSHGFGT
jgi:hypothetical protein